MTSLTILKRTGKTVASFSFIAGLLCISLVSSSMQGVRASDFVEPVTANPPLVRPADVSNIAHNRARRKTTNRVLDQRGVRLGSLLGAMLSWRMLQGSN